MSENIIDLSYNCKKQLNALSEKKEVVIVVSVVVFLGQFGLIKYINKVIQRMDNNEGLHNFTSNNIIYNGRYF